MKCFDNFTKPIHLNFESYNGHKTIFGGVLSILSYCFCISISFYFSLDLIYKDKPRSYFIKKFINDAGVYKFDHQGLFHAVSMGDRTTQKYIVIDRRAIKFIGLSSSGDSWEYDSCNYEIDVKGTPVEKIMTEQFLDNKLCLRNYIKKNSGVKITKNSSSINFTYPQIARGQSSNLLPEFYQIFGVECQNITLNDNCYSRSKIREIITSKGIELAGIENDVDISNYTNPIIPTLFKVGHTISMDTRIDNNLNFQPFQISTIGGIFFDYTTNLFSYYYDLLSKTNYNKEKDDTTIISFGFFLQNKMTFYERSYKKVQEVMADIGGATKFIFLFGYFLNYTIEKFQTFLDFERFLNLTKVTIKVMAPFFPSNTNVFNSYDIIRSENYLSANAGIGLNKVTNNSPNVSRTNFSRLERNENNLNTNYINNNTINNNNPNSNHTNPISNINTSTNINHRDKQNNKRNNITSFNNFLNTEIRLNAHDKIIGDEGRMNYCKFLTRFLCCKKDNYYKQINNLREDFLNEKFFFKLHIDMVKIKKKIFGSLGSDSENEISKIYLDELIEYFK